MNITAKEVRSLREMSGAGMMECKNALTKAGGNVENAFKLLREKGVAKAEKRSGRNANEGLIGIKETDKGTAIIEVNSETDFVSRNKEFRTLVNDILDITIQEKGNFEKTSEIASEKINEAVGKIGENIVFRRSEFIEGNIFNYTHNSIERGLGKIGVLLKLSSDKICDLSEIGKNICMHIAATSPLSILKEDLDISIIESEKEIILQQLKDSGKPDNILQKVIEGKLNKYLEEIVLMNQKYVIDPNLNVEEVIQDFNKSNNINIKIERFIRFQLGK